MNIIKSSDPEVARRFITLLLNLGFTKFNAGQFLHDQNGVDNPDECLRHTLELPYDEVVQLLTPYGESSCMYRSEMQNEMATRMQQELYYTPYVEEEPKKPSPIYPQWRGHKVKNKKRGW